MSHELLYYNNMDIEIKDLLFSTIYGGLYYIFIKCEDPRLVLDLYIILCWCPIYFPVNICSAFQNTKQTRTENRSLSINEDDPSMI